MVEKRANNIVVWFIAIYDERWKHKWSTPYENCNHRIYVCSGPNYKLLKNPEAIKVYTKAEGKTEIKTEAEEKLIFQAEEERNAHPQSLGKNHRFTQINYFIAV